MWTRYDSSGNPITTSSITGVWTTLNVKDYGATGNGSTDDKAAIQNAINAAGAAGVSGRGVDLYFPAGIYAVSGVLTCVFNNVMFRGSGWQSTVIYCTVTTGDVIQFGNGGGNAGCGLMNLSIWKSAQGTTGSNININGMNDCLIQNFVVNNAFTGITIQGASIKVWIDQGEINATAPVSGTGIQITNGAAGDTYMRSLVFSNATPTSLTGIAVTQSGHFEIINCNVTKCSTGLLMNPTGTQLVTYGFIEHSLFDSCVTNGMLISPSGAATAKVQNMMFIDSWFSGCTGNPGTGVNITTASSAIVDGFSFIGCRILNNFSNGVLIAAAGPQNLSFTACTISGNSQGSSGALDGVNIAANVSNISIMNCKCGQQGTAGNTQRYGINVAAGTSGDMQFIGNDCQPNVTVGTNGYINLGALTGGGNQIEFNTPCWSKGMDAATTAASAAITTTETIIGPSNVKAIANATRAGQAFRFVMLGSCTVSTAAAVPGKFILHFGTAGTTGDTAIQTFTLPTSGGVGTSAFRAEIEVVCRTVGAAATFTGNIAIVQASATLGLLATNATAVVGTAATASTLTANFLTLTFGNTGSANVSVTFQAVTSEFAVT